MTKVPKSRVRFSEHARTRFRERFPKADLDESWERAVQITNSEQRSLVTSNRYRTAAYFDEHIGALYVCDNDTVIKSRMVCTTVLRSDHFKQNQRKRRDTCSN